jgi:hypothetical protein
MDSRGQCEEHKEQKIELAYNARHSKSGNMPKAADEKVVRSMEYDITRHLDSYRSI